MTKKELKELKELRRLLEMKTAFFHKQGHFGIDRRDEEFTEEIREATRIWRETWILPVLDEMIDKYERRLYGKI